MPKPLLQITGVIPFSETIFLWQSPVIALVLIFISIVLARLSAPSDATAETAQMMGVDLQQTQVTQLRPRERPGEWLEYSPLSESELMIAVRSPTSRERTRCKACKSSCSSVFAGTQRVAGR